METDKHAGAAPWSRWFLALVLSGIGSAFTPRLSATDFVHDLKPILETKCLSCHNPNNPKGKLSLASPSDRLSDLIVAGQPNKSRLYEVTLPGAKGKRPEMPEKGEPLTDEERSHLRQWIAEGATWPEGVTLREASKTDGSWWAYQPLGQQMPAASGHPVDAFLRATLSEKNLTMSPPADRRTLIRRATYDLTGLPPNPEDVDAFVKDRNPQAYEALLDRLLASRHYGERWGRHWLDVVRFGESIGFERNDIINDAWPFRDYVIRSLNDDKPFDQFIREHLAGDVFGADDPDVAVGSAFLVAGPFDDVGNQDAVQKAQIRANTLDEIISATSEAFLGMTMGCARCHDHKFDPITQEDYYGLYATFSAVRHKSVPLGTPNQKAERAARLKPLNASMSQLEKTLRELTQGTMKRARAKLAEHATRWTRPSVDRTGTEERFEPTTTRFVRLVSEGQDAALKNTSTFTIDEFEIWSTGPTPKNVALASTGAKASGKAREIADFPGAYGPHLAIDGKVGRRFLARGGSLTIELKQPTRIDRVLFSSARRESVPAHKKFIFVAEYRIEISDDGKTWKSVANSHSRKPANEAHRDHRLNRLEMTREEKVQISRLKQEVNRLKQQIARIPALPKVWMGTRNPDDAAGPFHIFVGGSPQKRGGAVAPASLSAFAKTTPEYRLPAEATEGRRRLELAQWLTHAKNPLPARVLANRIWHYHFGVGIVDTPNDFGFMGGRPTHPELLDFLARELRRNGWKIKALHKLIMTSRAYRQSSAFNATAAKVDGDTRLLWRFPPRRLSAEEIRDTFLTAADKLNASMGGKGFRLYEVLKDNVSTYVPLDEHGPETYRRAVYHQNARASRTDLMTDFDQPDCAFSTPRRATTTTPLQALTALNHAFAVDMAEAFAARLQTGAEASPEQQTRQTFAIAYQRRPEPEEIKQSIAVIRSHGLRAFCRALLNSSELIYLD
jgi:hypothetical protein